MFSGNWQENGAPVGIRTPSLLIRSQVLYPIELRVHPKSLWNILEAFPNCKPKNHM